MKSLNGDKQMRSDWKFLFVLEKETKIEWEKLHSTQKPESLLSRVIISSTKY